MSGSCLTTASTILCPHGGQAILLTSNARVSAGGPPVLLETDVHPVAGCPFTVGPRYSPCVRIEWSAGSAKATAGGVAVLVQSSLGQCLNGEGAPQGVALVAATQSRGTAQ